MLLKDLSLVNFKNIESANLELSPKINCFLGDNGMGKSNLLDALYFLSYTKSFTGALDSMLVRRGEEFMTLRANYLRHDMPEEVTAGIQNGRRKTFKRAGKTYQRLTEHLGVLPLVMLSPADIELTSGEPSERRRFMNQIISQSNRLYFEQLLRYNAALEQRNKLLKDENCDGALLEVLEMQLEAAAEYIEQQRFDFIDKLSDIFVSYYKAISGNDEVPAMEYTGKPYPEGLAEHLKKNRGRDIALHYTASGPHRHDILFTIDGMPVRRSASQGQTKTFTTALRLAQYEILRKNLGMKPLLLLDDIFDKLDAGRVSRIMSIVGNSETFGQIFITDTNRRHLDDIVADMPADVDNYRLWHVVNGEFTRI